MPLDHALANFEPRKMCIAHVLIVVAFFVVNFFMFLVIFRTQVFGLGRKLVEILPTSLPDLPKQPRTLRNLREEEILETQHFRETGIF